MRYDRIWQDMIRYDKIGCGTVNIAKKWNIPKTSERHWTERLNGIKHWHDLWNRSINETLKIW